METKQHKQPCTESCELCGRRDIYLNFHHLIPKMLHGKSWFRNRFDKDYMENHGIWICKSDCHKTLHEFFKEKELGKDLNTLEKLLAHPKVQKYIAWVQKQRRTDF